MNKLDRLGWAGGLSVVSYGVRVGVRASDAALLPRLRALLPPGWRAAASPEVGRVYSLLVGGAGPRSGVRRFHVAYAGATPLLRSHDLDATLAALEGDLRLHVAERAPRRVFVHAGVVGWQGRAILLPGWSFSGKSRLVAALLRAGADYLSDEYAVLDARGRVHAYSAPLKLRDVDGPFVPPQAVAPAPSGARRPLRVSLVAFLEHRSGAGFRSRALSTGQAALALLQHTVCARSRPGRALAALRAALAGAAAVRGIRGEAEQVAPLVLRLAEVRPARTRARQGGVPALA